MLSKRYQVMKAKEQKNQVFDGSDQHKYISNYNKWNGLNTLIKSHKLSAIYMLLTKHTPWYK